MTIGGPQEETEFDHLDLSSEHRRLMCLAAANAKRIYLAPMDKGLSGCVVWQARWQMFWGTLSKLHVFKIGRRAKLLREEQAVINIASVIEIGFPLMRLFSLDDSDLALLRQEFVGDPEGTTTSLRLCLQDNARCPNAEAAVRLIHDLYYRRMQAWHGSLSAPPPVRERTSTLADELPRWKAKIDIARGADQIGRAALAHSLDAKYQVSLEALDSKVADVGRTPLPMRIGPVHGDLHAQNVNVDRHEHLHLIDFASTSYSWRAVDFIVMECALKFAVSPPNARLDDLLTIETLVERQWVSDALISCESLQQCMHGRDLEKIAAAICAVRRCARDLGAISDPTIYRYGLVYFTAALATIESVINRVFLFHSLAHQLSLLETRNV